MNRQEKREPETRQVIFIRHGESTWNDTFNKSKNPVLFIPRLLHAAVVEISFLVTQVRESWFYDSPLSRTGLRQATELRAFLQQSRSEPLAQTLLGRGGKSIVVSSILRRAISTGLVGLWDRLNGTNERIQLLPCLQEISRNPDTLCITAPQAQPQPSWVDARFKDVDMSDAYRRCVDPSRHEGNKSVDSNGLQRMMAFNSWAFQEDHGSIIAVGHSLWFRSFFREFLPRSFDHDCKSKKIANAGAVAFNLQRRILSDGSALFRIDPTSVKVVYGGFTKA